MQNEYHLRVSTTSGKLLIVSDNSDVPLVDANVDTLGTIPIVEDWISYGWAPGVDTSTVHNKDGSITTITADEKTLTKTIERRDQNGRESKEIIGPMRVVDAPSIDYLRTFDKESSTDFMRMLRGMSVIELKRFFNVLLRIQQGINQEIYFRITNFKNPKITENEWTQMHKF